MIFSWSSLVLFILKFDVVFNYLFTIYARNTVRILTKEESFVMLEPGLQFNSLYELFH